MQQVCSSKESSSSSPFSSPNISALLKIKIISWSQETGLPISLRVRIGDRILGLHKHPMLSKSGYFQKRLITESNEVELPHNFLGGPETFEMIVFFIYASSSTTSSSSSSSSSTLNLVDPFNVAALRCAAEFLEMTEEYCTGNLCDRFDLYLNQVVFQSWDDTLIVLQKCQSLLPWSEELLIVSRCIESLAFMACMEILDPERRRERPVVTLEALAREAQEEEEELWIKDLIALPIGFFKRIIGSLRRQGMKEKYVTPIIVFYARQFWDTGRNQNDEQTCSHILHGILHLLPLGLGDKASRSIPVAFYFALLSVSLEFGFTSDDDHSMMKLQDQIASMLHFAQLQDFLLLRLPTKSISSSKELAAMRSIFSTYVSLSYNSNSSSITPAAAATNCNPNSNSIVAELWDVFLIQVASDPEMHHKTFMELIETVPISYRHNHYKLYSAMNSFLQAHKDTLSQEERGMVCKYLNCQKLSQEACIKAVQNELMPLRLIVQALFVQQLNTHQAFKECSDSFRYTGHLSASLPSTRCPNSKSLTQAEGPPYTDGVDADQDSSRPLSFLLQNELAMDGDGDRSDFTKKDYESTSFRIQNLEKELMSLKKTLQLHNMPDSDKTQQHGSSSSSMKSYGLGRRSASSKSENPLGGRRQIGGCIGSINFASQRKYVSKLLKVICRFTFFGNNNYRKSKTRQGLWTKTM